MSIDLTGKSLEQLIELAKETLNQAEDAETTAEKQTAEKLLDDIITKYNKDARDKCYMACRAAEKPLQYAILQFYYEGIRVKETKDSETKVVVRSIDKARRPIDISNLWKWMHDSGKDCGFDRSWFYYAQKLNYLMTARAADRMGKPALKALFAKYSGECFAMDKIARDYDMGKTPCSNTNMLRALQMVISAMLGDEWKATSHDVNALCDLFAKDNRRNALGVTLPSHNAFRALLKKLCYRILTKAEGYDVESKEFDLAKAIELAEAVAGAKKESKKEPKKEEPEPAPVDEQASDEPDAE